jgi:glycosyltransferase involved in cell wall biosynthesis
MKSDIGIIYFGNDWFAENRTSSHHIAQRLSREYPLLYVETPGLRAPKATGRDAAKLWRKLRKAFDAPTTIHEQMWHMTVPQIPFRRLPLVNWLNRLLGTLRISRAAKRLGIRRPLLWFTVPHVAHLAGRLGEEFVVYYCIDDYASLPDIDSRAIGQMDQDLARRADQVFVSSPALVEPKRKINLTTEYSPHGVDVSLFQRARDPKLPVAEGARNLPHPVIGFYGLIEEWVDLELIAFLAEARPAWTFVLIGRVAVDIGRLAKLKNVIFPGMQPYETLPGWAKAFDVSIIPFRQNELVRNVNPLKLREYLAAGSPVVSVWMPEVERLEPHVAIARTHQEFLQKLDEALLEDSEEKRQARMKAVAGMTWDARVAEVLRTVRRRYAALPEPGRGAAPELEVSAPSA